MNRRKEIANVQESLKKWTRILQDIKSKKDTDYCDYWKRCGYCSNARYKADEFDAVYGRDAIYIDECKYCSLHYKIDDMYVCQSSEQCYGLETISYGNQWAWDEAAEYGTVVLEAIIKDIKSKYIKVKELKSYEVNLKTYVKKAEAIIKELKKTKGGFTPRTEESIISEATFDKK